MKKQRIVSFILAVVMVFGILPVISLSAGAAITSPHRKTNLSGSADRWFKADLYWDTETAIAETPLTFETVIKHPNRERLGGVLLGSYVDDKTPSISFYIGSTGRPAVRIVDNELQKWEYMFYDSGAYPYASSASMTHMAFTIDPVAKTVSYYEDGVLIATQTGSWGTLPTNLKYRVGGDFREGNTEYFKAAMNYVAIYNETRTAAQITADYNEVNTAWSTIQWDDDALIAAWDITKQAENACRDRSGNGNTLVYHQGEGVRLDTFGSYTIDQSLTGTPQTVEAWLYLPKCYDTRGGTYIGNYKGGSGGAYFAFEIQNSGHPRYFYANGDGTTGLNIFDKVDVRTSAWTHVAIVHDPNAVVTVDGVEITGATYCYINGVLAQTCAFEETVLDSSNKTYQTPVIEMNKAMLDEYVHFGGDRQGGGMTQRFNGFIKELRVYSDQRTATEIASDYAGNVDLEDEDIVLHYDLREVEEYTSFEDLTGNGHDVTYNQVWYGEVLPAEDYAYSLAVVGDTQTVTNSNPEKLKTIYQWILDNKDEKKIQYVIGLGDITEKGEDWGHKNNDTEEETAVGDAQWAAALEAISMMDGKIPYSLIRGAGHDGRERFNEWFGDHKGYTDNITGYYKEGRIENVYHTFHVNGIDYMILCLDFGAKDDVLAWANEVVAAHPAHRVIVTTHGYLDTDGTLLETGEPYCPSQSYYDVTNNDGDDLWNKFVRKHANIQMVLCGHMTTSDVVISTQTGDHGNEVTQILIDPQGLDTSSTPRGMVAMFYFSKDGKTVDVQYYSTITNSYRPSTSFEVNYGTVEAPDYETLSEDYLVVRNEETGLYSVVENEYFAFLGGGLRYSDATAGFANIRFGYTFDSDFDLTASDWKWNYGVKGAGLNGEKLGESFSSANRTNLVITGVPAAYFADAIEAQLSFEIEIDGVKYTAIDRIRERSVLGIAESIVKSPAESAEAKAYAQTIVDALNAG